MAKLHPKPYTYAAATAGYTMDAMNEQQAELTRLEAHADKLADGAIKGAILSFPVADGKALYLVTSDKPVTLQHLPFFDGYAIPDAHIRGLNKDDVQQKVAQANRWRKLFSEKVPVVAL